MPGPATYDPDYDVGREIRKRAIDDRNGPVVVARGPGDIDPDAIQTQDEADQDDGLPDDFEEFLEVSETEECSDCGSLFRPRFVEDGVCMGCRYGSPEGGDAGA